MKDAVGEKSPKERVAPKEGEAPAGVKVYELKKKRAEHFGKNVQPKTASQLGLFWMHFVPLHHDTEPIDNLTTQQYGQLKHIMKNLEEHPDWLMPTIRWAIKHWSAFTQLAKIEKVATLGATPNIGTLLAYLDTAVNGMLKKKHLAFQLMAPKKKMPTKFVVGKVL